MSTTQVYVVRDSAGEYVRPNGTRTPAGNEAAEFDTPEDARAACDRATDQVLARDAEYSIFTRPGQPRGHYPERKHANQ